MGIKHLLCAACVLIATTTEADTLIRGALVVNGTGSAPYTSDVAIRDGRIAAIGALTASSADTVVDAAGLVLTPGFVDAHSHHDRFLGDMRDAPAAVSQGITTVVVGVDGESSMPLADYFATLKQSPAAINVASFSGHGSLRRRVMGADYQRHATEAELARMSELLEADMTAGALGLSSGLEYDPGIYSSSDELVALARVAAAHGGIYASHVRSEDVNLDAALAEVATIAREAHIPGHISHLKISLIDRWGQAPALLKRLDGWRAEGLDITADVYPYTYWHSSLTSIFPQRDFSNLDAARHALAHVAPADGIILTTYKPEPAFVGKSVAAIAKARGESPEVTLMWLINRAYPDGDIDSGEEMEAVMGMSMREDDVAAFLAWDHATICSDGMLVDGHPRGAGTFTRYLRQHVKLDDPASLARGIQRMTGDSAAQMGLKDRGIIGIGRAADLVLLDPKTVGDNATLENPGALSSGVRAVWVNGVQVWDGSKTTGAYPGRGLVRSETVRISPP